MIDRECPSFGTMIRATRLGWGWSRKHKAFIRMSDRPNMHTFIELVPMHGVLKTKCKGGEHRCWWDKGQEILDMIPWLKDVRQVRKSIGVLVDEHGAIVKESVT